MVKAAEFEFEDISKKRPPRRRGRGAKRFRTYLRSQDGTKTLLGVVEHRWIRHMRQLGWEATATDGSHRAVHDEQWQAAWALQWDGHGYPFPVTQRGT